MSGFSEILLIQEGLLSVIKQIDELEKKQPALKSALESAVDLKLEKIKQRVADVETEKGKVVERVSLVSDEVRRTAGELKTQTEKIKAQLLAKVAFEAQARESSLKAFKEQAEESINKIARDVTRSMIDEFAAKQAAEMEQALALEAERAPNAADFNNLSQNWASLYVGNYEPDKQLKRGDIFTFYGGTYLCLIDSTGVHPSMNEIRGENPRFAILAAPGAPGQAGLTGENSTVAGPAGPAGPTGPTGPAGESTTIDASRTENLLVALSRIVRLLESSAVVDQQQRQRVSLDTIPAGVTLPTVTTVGTVTTLSTLTNATAIAGMDREQYINIANNTYAQSIRKGLTFV
jgi:hypothetical protein